MSRQRQRPIRRPGPSAPPAAPAPAQRPARSPAPVVTNARVPHEGWRGTIESFGGFVTVGVVLVAIVVVIGIVIWTGRNNSTSTAAPSEDPLMGEAIDIGTSAAHVLDPSQLQIPPGRPPVGGPHFPVPQQPGIYDAPTPDGNTIHALEHGVIWISYNPAKVDQRGIDAMKSLAKRYADDVILSPRPENDKAVSAASWGRLLQFDSVDTKQIEQFIKTNRNRSPERVRGAGNTSTR